MSEKETNLYRIEWQEDDGEGGTYTERNYFIADEEPTPDKFEKEVTIKEATKEEQEAYISGYEDGFDVATVANRMTKETLEQSGFTMITEPHHPNEDELLDIFRSDDLNI